MAPVDPGVKRAAGPSFLSNWGPRPLFNVICDFVDDDLICAKINRNKALPMAHVVLITYKIALIRYFEELTVFVQIPSNQQKKGEMGSSKRFVEID